MATKRSAPVRLGQRDILQERGRLLAPCVCGHKNPLGAYASAQMGAGHRLTGACEKCRRPIVLLPTKPTARA